MKKSKFSTNFLYNIVGAMLPIAISLGTVPFYIHQIGLARYGIVSITWVLLGYFGFLDFGMSRASANALARLGDSDPRERSRVLMTTFYSNLGMGVIGGLVLYAVGQIILLHIVKIPSSLTAEVRTSYPWMAAMLPLGMLGSICTGALESRERFLLSNVLSSFGSMSGQIIPLLCAYTFGPSLVVVIPSILLSRLLTVFLGFAVVMKLEWPIRLLDLDIGWLRKLLGYGSWVTVSSVLNPLLDTSNQLIVGATLGASAVANYSVPMTLAMRSQVVATALSRTLFPRISRVSLTEAAQTTQQATSTLAYGFGMICGPAILFSSAFLHLWIGARFAVESAAVAQILMFGAWTNGLAFLPYNFLQAQGRPNITAKVGLFEILPFFMVLWLLIDAMGLPGAALAWMLRVTINCLVLFLLSGCITRQMAGVVPAVIVMVGSLVLARALPMTMLIAAEAAAAVGVLFAIMGIIFDPTLRTIARKAIHRRSRQPQ